MLRHGFIKSFFIVIVSVLVTSQAYALEHIHKYIPDAGKVGEGRLVYFMFDVYDAALYAPQGQFEQGQAFALELSYLRKIPGKKIADKSIEKIREQGLRDEVTLATWHAQMRDIFPDVEKGVRLTGVRTEEGAAVFYQGDIFLGRIDDPTFSKAFFDIWLSEQTSSPSLRLQLLGEGK